MDSQGTTAPTFSRLQLAAALIEYDNDPDDPDPPRKAHDSAIFSRLRTQNPAYARKLTGYEQFRETPNHLGVQLSVNDAASTKLTPPQPPLTGTRSSKGSIDLLRNPFGADVESEVGKDEEHGSEEEEPEVDLEAWGMSNFLGNKESSRSRQRTQQQRERRISKAHSEMLPNPYTSTLKTSHHQQSKSLGGLGDAVEAFGGGGPLIASEADFRRRTLSSPLDFPDRITPDFQRPLSRGSPRLLPNRPALQHHPLSLSPNHIPFPTGTSTPEPGQEEEQNVFELPLTAPISRFDPKSARARTTSRGSRGSLGSQSKLELIQQSEQLDNVEGDELFALNSDRASRFDVDIVVNKFRPLSIASFGGTANTFNPAFDLSGDNDRASSFGQALHADTKEARTRSISNVSLGSRLPPENEPEPVEEKTGRLASRRFSRLDLLRPKVLIMPGPLQNLEEQASSSAPDVPAGFQLATLGPPLPLGTQTGGPVTLTPNPRLSLTLSQLTFRNSLMTDGQRDVTFLDIENNLRRAEKDGEQIIQEEDIEEEIAQEQRLAHGRPAGKLYGRSLMDELQARKEKLKGKQRVFVGDQRLPMMTRSETRHSQPLINPATLRDLPLLNHVQANAQDERADLQRRPSKSKPLLNFDNPVSPGAYKASTFGHDGLWESDIQRRKLVEKTEEAEEAEHQRKEAAKAARKQAKKRKNTKEEVQPPKPEPQPRRMSVLPDLPPVLPSIPTTATARRAPPAAQDESESESDSEASLREAKLKYASMAKARTSEDWVLSDDEGLHPAKRVTSPPKAASGSDEDLPLAALARGTSRPVQLSKTGSGAGRDSDSEDEQPLSQVIQQKLSVSNFGFGDFNINSIVSAKNEEEDDVPLAVRHPRAATANAIFAQNRNGDDDDDKPLGLKQLQSQQQLQQLQQQQMQYQNYLAQQQMMMMQPPMTMSFAAPPLMNGFTPFMMSPQQIPMYAPQPVRPDNAKLQSVDRWRHGVEN